MMVGAQAVETLLKQPKRPITSGRSLDTYGSALGQEEKARRFGKELAAVT